MTAARIILIAATLAVLGLLAWHAPGRTCVATPGAVERLFLPVCRP